MRKLLFSTTALLAITSLSLSALASETKAGKKETQKAAEKIPGLDIKDTKVGTGAEAVSGKTVKVHYVGKLENGTVFDESAKHGGPFEFPLGKQRVIPGWEMGIVGMKVGGKRTLKIAPDLGYRDQGAPPAIPPNATLIFDVELIGVN